MQNPLSFLRKSIEPRSLDEDIARRERILNILLVSAFVLFALATALNTIEWLLGTSNPVSALALLSFCLLIFTLYLFSRSGNVLFPSTVLTACLFLFATYMVYVWGVHLPSALFLYVLVITMAGVLLSTRFAILFAVLTSLCLAIIGLAQNRGVIVPDLEWTTYLWSGSEIAVASTIFLIISVISWLSNREMEKSLRRARHSEAELKKERDLLEERVEERTQELKQAQMEQMTQAYRFVEFGRLASGFFHDLSNPLSALSMNMSSIADSQKGDASVADDIARAQRATGHIEKLLGSLRKHLTHDSDKEHFSVTQAVKETLDVLDSYARVRDVTLTRNIQDGIETVGNRSAFVQILTNLVSNAIESYETLNADTSKHQVIVKLQSTGESIKLSVADKGVGMSEEQQASAFEPFVSTKKQSNGLGLGLSLARRLSEKEFTGALALESVVGKGTTFTLQFPMVIEHVSDTRTD